MRELVLLFVLIIAFVLVACANHSTGNPDYETSGGYSAEEGQAGIEASEESSAEDAQSETETPEDNSRPENDTEDAPAQEETPGLGEYVRITATQAKEMMAATEEFVLLDVRTPEEFAEGYIEGAILIPHTEIAARAVTELTEKDMLILVYCRSGRRSEEAARALLELGYTNVYDFGGIIDWPYETVH